MAIELDELVLQAREHLTELPESQVFSRDSLATLVPSAIAAWQIKTINDRKKRQNFTVESNPLPIVAGVIDLSDAITTYGYRVDYLEEGDIEIESAADKSYDVKFVPSRNRLRNPGIQDAFFLLAHLSGTKLQFRDPDAISPADPLTNFAGSIIIRSVVLPKSLDAIPYTILPELAFELAEIAKRRFRGETKGMGFMPKQ